MAVDTPVAATVMKEPHYRCSLADGTQGVTHEVPPGDVVSCDDHTLVDDNHGMTVHDIAGRLQWSFKFFENLHMDVSPAQAEHLRDAMERKARALFEEHYQIREGRRMCYPSTGSSYPHRRRTPSAIRPQDDPTWSPIIDVEYVSVLTKGDSTGTPTTAVPNAKATSKRRSVSSTTQSDNINTTHYASVPGVLVIHRLAYSLDEQIVMGRFLLPLRRGLYEVIVIAGDGGNATGVGGSSTSPLPVSTPTTTTTTALGEIRTLAMDGPEYDSKFPNHCLSRVRRAMKWLTTEASMRVTDIPLPSMAAGSEVELSHLHCRIVVPPRFLYCPNPYTHPESNKYRFCRATLGGTDGVEMMVVSCWYGKDIGKGLNALRKVAVHGARVIHESQQMVHIRIDALDVNLGTALSSSSSSSSRQSISGTNPVGKANGSTSRGRWLLPVGGGITGGRRSNNKDAIITVIDCADAQGTWKQNTIGWIRESTTGTIYLVYFADTLYMDQEEVHREIAGTLASIRVPRLLPLPNGVRRKLAWHATSPAPVASS